MELHLSPEYINLHNLSEPIMHCLSCDDNQPLLESLLLVAEDEPAFCYLLRLFSEKIYFNVSLNSGVLQIFSEEVDS